MTACSRVLVGERDDIARAREEGGGDALLIDAVGDHDERHGGRDVVAHLDGGDEALMAAVDVQQDLGI